MIECPCPSLQLLQSPIVQFVVFIVLFLLCPGRGGWLLEKTCAADIVEIIGQAIHARAGNVVIVASIDGSFGVSVCHHHPLTAAVE
jgi:hypothetical protein